jgi:archaemetzincin
MGLGLALALCLAGCARNGADRGFVLTSFGAVDPADLAVAESDLRATFQRPVRRLAAQTPPPEAWLTERAQWDAERLLAALDALPLRPGEKAVALVDADGARTDLTFVFGLAVPQGRCAVVFLPRLRDGDAAAVHRRLRTELRHEVGHLYGLPHCDDPRCVMAYSTTVGEVDAKGEDFCARCLKRLAVLRRPRG